MEPSNFLKRNHDWQVCFMLIVLKPISLLLTWYCKPISCFMPHLWASIHCLEKKSLNWKWAMGVLTLYLIEKLFNAFANRVDPDQAALVRAAWSGSTLFFYGNMIYIYLILLKWTWQVIHLFCVPTWNFIYMINIHSGWSLAWIFMKETV